ncbi:hypothetical protein HYW17_05865 [Candidatus Uhrbacteria bacterium]|nr:hypothetical protein [Candidatus Uhrbacteria bacterium]
MIIWAMVLFLVGILAIVFGIGGAAIAWMECFVMAFEDSGDPEGPDTSDQFDRLFWTGLSVAVCGCLCAVAGIGLGIAAFVL